MNRNGQPARQRAAPAPVRSVEEAARLPTGIASNPEELMKQLESTLNALDERNKAVEALKGKL